MARRVWLAVVSAGTLRSRFPWLRIVVLYHYNGGAGGRCHDIVIGGGMPHSDHEWGEGAWLGGCGLQWSVLELCVLDFLGYVLWSFTTITEGVGGRCHDIVIGGGMPHSDHEWGEGVACSGQCWNSAF